MTKKEFKFKQKKRDCIEIAESYPVDRQIKVGIERDRLFRYN